MKRILLDDDSYIELLELVRETNQIQSENLADAIKEYDMPAIHDISGTILTLSNIIGALNEAEDIPTIGGKPAP